MEQRTSASQCGENQDQLTRLHFIKLMTCFFFFCYSTKQKMFNSFCQYDNCWFPVIVEDREREGITALIPGIGHNRVNSQSSPVNKYLLNISETGMDVALIESRSTALRSDQ